MTLRPRMASWLALLVFTLLSFRVNGLEVSDLFYMDITDETPANCAAYGEKLSSGLNEAKTMASKAVEALDLLAKPYTADPDTMKTWEYYFHLFLTVFYGPGDDAMDPEGSLNNLEARKTARKFFAYLHDALSAEYDKSKQIFCDPTWWTYLRAEDEDPLTKDLIETTATDTSVVKMKHTYADVFRQRPSTGFIYRRTHPPEITPAYGNSFLEAPGLGRGTPTTCPPGDSAQVARPFNALVFCPTHLQHDPATLEDALKNPQVREGIFIGDPNLRSNSLIWVHEMMHWVANIQFEDENVEKDIVTGQPLAPQKANGWWGSIALAKWEREKALKNVENYVQFAKAVLLRGLAPQWSFLFGYARRDQGLGSS